MNLVEIATVYRKTSLKIACRQKDQDVIINFVAAGQLSSNKFQHDSALSSKHFNRNQLKTTRLRTA
jgi:hypothetical protein